MTTVTQRKFEIRRKELLIDIIKDLLSEKILTGREMAKMLGLDSVVVSYLKTGTQNVKLSPEQVEDFIIKLTK